MSFTIRLSQDLTAVEAGATVPLSIDIVNKGEESDRFEMQVEGIDPEWTASPEPVFNVAAGESHSQKLFFKPPRASESLAGNYPFVVRVRSLNSGESRTAQGVLQIKPFHHLSMEISPRKGYSSPMRQQNVFGLTLMNLGNTEHTLQLSGADPEEECTYDFTNEQITVGPGQQKQVDVTVRTANAGWISSVKLFGFSIGARSIQNPTVMASSQAQLERRPLLTVGTLATLVFFVALALLWVAFRPQPPSISLSAERTTVLQGESVAIRWRGDNANSVRLEIMRSVDGKVEGPEKIEDLSISGTREIQLSNKEDTLTITAFAIGENKTQASRPITISVQVDPLANPPKITKFTASPRSRVKLGEPILFTFEYSADTSKLVLSPLTDREILPPAKQIQITPTQVGEYSYYVIAYNRKGKAAQSKPIRIEVYRESEANIIDFSANPGTVMEPESRTTISWNVANAQAVQLDDGSGTGLKTVDPVGSMEVPIDKTVNMKLIAIDAKNVATSKKLIINYKKLPPVTPPTTAGDTGGNPPPTTGTDGGGTTTGGN